MVIQNCFKYYSISRSTISTQPDLGKSSFQIPILEWLLCLHSVVKHGTSYYFYLTPSTSRRHVRCIDFKFIESDFWHPSNLVLPSTSIPESLPEPCTLSQPELQYFKTVVRQETDPLSAPAHIRVKSCPEQKALWRRVERAFRHTGTLGRTLCVVVVVVVGSVVCRFRSFSIFQGQSFQINTFQLH